MLHFIHQSINHIAASSFKLAPNLSLAHNNGLRHIYDIIALTAFRPKMKTKLPESSLLLLLLSPCFFFLSSQSCPPAVHLSKPKVQRLPPTVCKCGYLNEAQAWPPTPPPPTKAKHNLSFMAFGFCRSENKRLSSLLLLLLLLLHKIGSLLIAAVYIVYIYI